MCLYSVVVPVYNSEHTLQELYTRLEKVFRETIKEEFELILVDDGSRDRSLRLCKNSGKKIPVSRSSRWQGISDSILRFCADLPMQRRVHRNYG